MICWVIKNGVPFDVAHAMDEYELLAYTIDFAKLANSKVDWDWDKMTFTERR